MDGKNYLIQDTEILARVRSQSPSQEIERNLAVVRRQLSELSTVEAFRQVARANREIEADLRQMEEQLRNAPRNVEEAQKNLAEAQQQLNRFRAENEKLEVLMRMHEEQLANMMAEFAKVEAEKARQ
jgi:chromosome segregation ATPase